MPSQANQAFVDRHGRAAGEQEGGAAGDAVHAERADEGRHAQLRDQPAVDEARDEGDADAGGEAEQHRRERVEAECRDAEIGDMGGHDGREAHDEADREVDAAEMMTKVWPRARSSGAAAKMAIDCRL